MKKLFARFSVLALMSAAVFMSFDAVAANYGDPIVTFHSNAWQEVGESNQFSMFLSCTTPAVYTVDMGDYVVEYDVVPGTVNVDEDTWDGTWIPVHTNSDGDVKIYGDASLVNVISIDGGYLTSFDCLPCENLEVLSLQHNSLENLDLTPFKYLYAIYLSDNPFTGEQSVVIGKEKPYLSILEMDIIDKMAPGFNLSDYPQMRVFDGYHNFGLTSIDTSGCPNLLSLSLEMTAVESLDVSNNPLLRSLNISESRITDIDISNLKDLLIFLAGHDSGWVNKGYRLNSIDLTNNTELFYLSISGNHLGSLDLSKNTKLTHLMAGRNDLRELDLSANTELYSVSVVFNDLDFATLPLPGLTWGEYWYMQNELALPRSIAKGSEIDLSTRVLRDGTTTTASLWASPVGGEDYEVTSGFSYADGKFSIDAAMADSVYVKFSNSIFYEYPLRTSKFMVKEASEIGQPSCIVTMAVDPSAANLRFAVGMNDATPATPKKFLVELSSGVYTEFTTTFSDTPTGYTVDIPMPADYNGYVGIYMPEGEVMTSFSADGLALTAINVTKATELRYLSLDGCGIYDVNLAYNRCLRTLNVSNNNLTQLDLQGIYGNYAKNVLTTVKASHNNLSTSDSFKYNDTAIFLYLDLSYNNFDNFKLLEFENLEYVDLSHNNLSEELYLTYQNDARHIDLSYNNLPSVVIDSFSNLDCLDLTNNVITLGALPLPSEIGNCSRYVYAPQKVYELPQKAPAVNLTDQNRVVAGAGTTFDWRKADGTPLVQDVDYTCDGGATRFLKSDLGSVYCLMTNPAFPQFAGENVYRTSEITPMEFPTTLVATFTTTKDSNSGDVTFTASRKTELYIDWHGDGSELISYPVKTSYINYPGQTTYAGAEVKVYSYEQADLITVFSVTGIAMSKADLTPLSKVTCINLSGSGLSEADVKLPAEAPVSEFSMASCKLTAFPWAEQYASSIAYINLARNSIKTFDASKMPKLQTLTLDFNNLEDITFNNPILWGLSLASNDMTHFDFTGLSGLDQINLSDNKLSSLDLAPVASFIKVLMVNGNCFTFSSLPVASDYSRLTYYTYSGQADVVAECMGGKVDLSSCAATADGVASTFTWYLGEAVFDTDNQIWTGTVLTEGEDYTVENGITTFLHGMTDQVMCLIDNEAFPNLTMKTCMITVDLVGVEAVEADDADSPVDVYNTLGILLRRQVAPAEAVKGLLPGCYIVGSKKVVVK